MLTKDAIKKITKIFISNNAKPVVKTCAEELCKLTNTEIIFTTKKKISTTSGCFYIGSEKDFDTFDICKPESHKICTKITQQSNGYIVASKSYLLYSAFIKLIESEENIDLYENGKVIETAYNWQRLSYDYFISQEGRIARNLNKENYIRNAARNGFTHIDINSLGHAMPLDNGPKGETYSMFYTYCAALDQFVYSKLNKGLYQFNYLSTNLNNLIKNAKLAVKYGMVPGFTSFEPRNVPEEFFQRYPMLRGARVDHPFRSFKPRYNMTTTHPKVLEHYAEMVKKLLSIIPELGFLSVWSSDSGAGFEYTNSLYVGRNGGAYLIREWNTHEKIAKQAAENVIRFLRTLRDAANEINPDFRVMTRLEPFYGEHEHIWNGFGNGIDAETNSLIAQGWNMPYHHAKYEDDKMIMGGSLHMQEFFSSEKEKIDDLANRNAHSHYYFAAGSHCMFEPLLGVSYPKATYKRLKTLCDGGVKYLAHIGGSCSPDHVPYNVNHEIVSAFQYNRNLNIDDTLKTLALKWAGEKYCDAILKVWDLTDEAALSYPNVSLMYSVCGFTWYRLWQRPFVPNYEVLTENERSYYEDFMCTTPHNPNNVDLSKDVLFELTTFEQSEKNIGRINKNVLPLIDSALKTLEPIVEEANSDLGSRNIVYDLYIRVKAMKIWFTTQLNVAKWVVSVHGYQNSEESKIKNSYRQMLKYSINSEIENTRCLQTIWDSGVEFMILTDKGETVMVYGDNLGDLLDTRIKLMKKHINDEPYIDPDYVMRKAGEPVV
jgi:hypothetical protein